MTRTVAVLVVLFALVGCQGQAENGQASDSTSGSEESDPNAQRMIGLTPPTGGGEGQCALATVYFGFDADTLSREARDAISAAVDCIRSRHTPANLHITGSTDPQGTEEYNLSLGERRARAVQRYLSDLGVDAARIRVSSVGEEMASGEDEVGYARDRNAETRISD